MIWTVPPFGWNCSTYFTLRMFAWASEICIENHTDTNNTFHWHHVQFNLSCTTGYDTSLPCVLFNNFDGEVVVRVIIFFDGRRVYGIGAEHARSGLRQICAGLQYLGNQEAARKCTAGGQWPQDWCGCCVYTE